MSAGNIIRPAFAWDAGHFTQMPNTWVRDQRISRRARGLLLELLSHGAAWQTSIKSLADAGPEGEAAIRVTLKELRDAGYLKMRREHDAQGRLGQTNYVLQDPWSGPKRDSPHVAEPHVEDRTTKKNISQKNNAQKAAPPAPRPPEHEQAEATDRALLPAAEDVVIDAWAAELQRTGAGARTVTKAQRDMLRRMLRDGIAPERMAQVIQWAFRDERGAYWRSALATLGGLRKHWATMHLQAPQDWAPREAAADYYAREDAKLEAQRAREFAHLLEAVGMDEAAWWRLSDDEQQGRQREAEYAGRYRPWMLT